MAVLYSFICDNCGAKGDVFCDYDKQPTTCPACYHNSLRRNYMAETKHVRPDWEPGFNRSMGIQFSGRRELFEKARGAGFGLYGHGGSVFNNKHKRWYSDEEYALKTGRLQPVDQKYLELLKNGVKSDGAQPYREDSDA